MPPTEAALIGLSQDGVRLQNGQVLKCKHARLLGSVQVPRLQAMAAGGGGGRARDKRKAKMQGQDALTKRARCGDWTMKEWEQAPREGATAGASAGGGGRGGGGGGGGDRGDVVVLSWVEVVLEEGKNREVNVSVVIACSRPILVVRRPAHIDREETMHPERLTCHRSDYYPVVE